MTHLTASETSKSRRSANLAWIVPFMLLCFSACHFQADKHDPKKAVLDANKFLKALYIDENPSEALKFCTDQVRAAGGADALRRMLTQVNQDHGRVKTLAADSYFMEPGAGMTLFYVGTYDNGKLYYRLAVVGDASTGYRVNAIFFKPEPYPDREGRVKFDTEIPVQ
jgi:hypothetical protein